VQARILLDHDTIHATTNITEIREAVETGRKIWIELERHSHDAEVLLAETLKVHPLTLEDIWGVGTHPKVDDYANYLYVVVHGIGAAHRGRLELVEVDVVIGPTWLVTHDRDGLVADDIGTELDHSPRMLGKGVAWLAHAVLDRVVDRYLPVIDELDVEIDQLETDVLERAGTPRGRSVLARILAFKRTLQRVRRMSTHQRETLLKLSRGEYDEIPPEALPFYRDVHDHFLRVQDMTEGYRDLVTSALDAYLSVQSNRMNEVVKALTLMSTVMLPLTFIAGVYGMNFKGERSPLNMPELEWYFGYPFALGLMATVTLMIVWWFRRRGWIGDGRRRQGAWLEEGSGDGADAGREAGALAIVPPPVHAGLVAAPAARGPASRIAISRPGPRGPRSAAERADQAAPASLAPRPPRARG
jgi:magnesium transporter